MVVYTRRKKLRPAKEWDQYLVLEHGQYHAYCYHYRIPDELLREAEQQGARRLEAPFSCERDEAAISSPPK